MIEDIFSKKMQELIGKGQPKIAIAVSGGGDSMALALLTAKYYKNIAALTVNHGLRKEAAKEVKQVKAWLVKRKIKTEILEYKGKKPEANIMSAAREIRYKLMLDWCKKNKFGCLLVAQNLEDQAETFLIRLQRGSGVDGLSAISEVSKKSGIKILRPLLEVSREELREYLKKNKQKWIEDPTNQNEKYLRNNLRKILTSTFKGEEKIIYKRLSDAAKMMKKARVALEFTEKLLQKEAVIKTKTSYEIDLNIFKKYPEEIRLRLLARLLMEASGNEYKPRFDDLERLHNRLLLEPKTSTLHGCLIKVGKGKNAEKAVISKEKLKNYN